MYNKYMPGDSDMFSELYRPIEEKECLGCVTEKREEKNEAGKRGGFDLKRLLRGIDVDKMGILPIVLLLLLLLDVDDEEKMIIIALVAIFGI